MSKIICYGEEARHALECKRLVCLLGVIQRNF